MNVLLFGTGDYYNRYKKWFEQHKVLALLDNSEKKKHKVIDNIKVLLPEEGVKLSYDIIVILSFYVKQMKQQLISLGVEQRRIYHFYDLHILFGENRIKRPIQYSLHAEEIIAADSNLKPKILLMSNDLTIGGPEIAIFYAAIILKEHGFNVVFSSMIDGPMREKLIQSDIPVIVDENLQVATMKEIKWIKTFSLVICNTLNFHIFLSERDLSIPVIWWLHDASFFYDGVNKNIIGKINLNYLKTVTVGPVPAKAVKNFLPHIRCDELLYGVEDVKSFARNKSNNKIVQFVTIGFLENIKGQDLLIQAIQKLPDDIRNQCKFYIVGYQNTLFGDKVYNEGKDLKEVIFTGNISHKEVHRLLNNTDILVCPSRQDSMPTVVVEAMMHSVPCIVSDVTGIASYIHNEMDGFVFKNEDVQMLVEKIEWCVTNKKKLMNMGLSARKLYERYFSMETFENALLNIINEIFEN